jgi:hypothetical protein
MDELAKNHAPGMPSVRLATYIGNRVAGFDPRPKVSHFNAFGAGPLSIISSVQNNRR